MPSINDPGRGYHDIGGLSAGPVDMETTNPKPWEKLSTAISNAMGRAGRHVFVTDEGRRSREQMGEPLYSDLAYFERATQSMRMILIEKGLFTEQELEDRMVEIDKRMAEQRK
jgi:nitrile hydratase